MNDPATICLVGLGIFAALAGAAAIWICWWGEHVQLGLWAKQSAVKDSAAAPADKWDAYRPLEITATPFQVDEWHRRYAHCEAPATAVPTVSQIAAKVVVSCACGIYKAPIGRCNVRGCPAFASA